MHNNGLVFLFSKTIRISDSLFDNSISYQLKTAYFR